MSNPIFLSDWTLVQVSGKKAEIGRIINAKDVVVSGYDTAAIMRNKDYIRRALMSTVSKGADRGKKVNKLLEQFKPKSVVLTKEVGATNQ